MTQEIIATIGLPASGKSTWAYQYAKEHPEYVVIEKDEIRKQYPNMSEDKVIKIRDIDIMTALKEGKSVISADTNFNPIHIKSFTKLGKQFKVPVRVKDFTYVTTDECIKRDKARKNSVGDAVIFHMFNQYLNEKIVQNPKHPHAIICDIDGTIAIHNRSPYDYPRCHSDSVNEELLKVLHKEKQKGNLIFFVSGRPSEWRDMTLKWLQDNKIPFDDLFMRRTDDNRDDTIVKKELFNGYIRDKYFIEQVFDDRPKVIRMWNTLGLNVLDVGKGIEF